MERHFLIETEWNSSRLKEMLKHFNGLSTHGTVFNFRTLGPLG